MNYRIKMCFVFTHNAAVAWLYQTFFEVLVELKARSFVFEVPKSKEDAQTGENAATWFSLWRPHSIHEPEEDEVGEE